MTDETKSKLDLAGKLLKEKTKKSEKKLVQLIIYSVVLFTVGLTCGRLSVSHPKTKKENTDSGVEVANAGGVKEEPDALKGVEEGGADEASTTVPKIKEAEEKPNFDKLPWNLALVNEEYPMDPAYAPELTEMTNGYMVDARIEKSLDEMLKAAEAAGMQMHICSAYRSMEKQTEVYNDSIKDRIAIGDDYLSAYLNVSESVALPGTSEHGIGLAVDIVSNDYELLDEQQAETQEAKWLAENCYKYGFILRYPPEKTDITGITYEPWHYRYVGVEHAKEITELGMTLEEYLQQEDFQ